MAEQTFRSPGFFEREIDLASRRQAVSGVPGGVIGTSAKGPAFVPVTVGDFADFVSRFGTLDPDQPAVYAAFEFLKHKRALTFMRVLGAGGNISAADRDETRTSGAVKGAGFRVHGKQTTINRKNIAHSDNNETHTSIKVLDGGPFLISAQHKTDVATKSALASNTLPSLSDNPSFNADGYASMLRGVVFTSAGYRLTAMPVGSTYTYNDPSLSGDVKASVILKGDRTDATNAVGNKITLISLDSDQVSTTSKTYVLVDSVSSDADRDTAHAPLTTGAVLGDKAVISATVPNDLANKLDLNGFADDNNFSINVPANAGGAGGAITILINSGDDALPAAADNQIGINAFGLNASQTRDLVVLAINGNGNGTGKIRYANAATRGDNDPAGGAAQAQAAVGGIPGIFAMNGDDTENITLRATRPGQQAHSVVFLNGGGGGSIAKNVATSFSGGTKVDGTATDIAVAIAESETLLDVLPKLETAIDGSSGHDGALVTAFTTNDGAGNSELLITQNIAGSVGNTAVTQNIAAVALRNGADNAAATTFTGGVGGAEVILQTDGLVSLMDAANSISSQEFNVLIIGTNNSTVYRTIKASLDPEHPSYISKVLNTDPHKFLETKHLLYLDLPVEDELAPVAKVFVAPPADKVIADAPFAGNYQKAWSVFGRMDTRYTTARSPAVISQPFGSQEYDIMHFESLSDGASGNEEVKISIANIKASLDPANPYGTFEVVVRKFRDLDSEIEILESYPGCTLDPNSENFVARLVGDYKTFYNFDADLEEERRIIVKGKYPNRSLYVRVVMSDLYESGEVPKSALPFGFRGIPVLKTSESLTDSATVALTNAGQVLGNAVASAADLIPGNLTRVDTSILIDETDRRDASLASPVFPPLPLRYKVTRGKMPTTAQTPSGNPALTEKVDSKLYWGLKSERVPLTGSVSNSILNPNGGGVFNEIVTAYTKFQGLPKSNVLVSGSATDVFNANKFTLARVALNKAGSAANIASAVTGSARDHMLEAVYLRDAAVEGSNYTITDPAGPTTRVSMATLLASSSVKFNRFTAYNKFTFPLYGGFDGLNILDLDSELMNDKASSADAPANFEGRASTEFDTNFTARTGLYEGKPGIGQRNSTVITYQQAARIMTDPMTVRHNILAIPGIRDSFVTDFAADNVKDYSLAIYLMDIAPYSEGITRLFGTENRTDFDKLANSTPDIRETAEQFSGRIVDNNYSAAYFPDVVISDDVNLTQVKVPASVAAMKALSFNDSVSFPWFAPAGFNRGALDNVTNVDVRLTAGDRDELYDARINPIANFPDGGFVIFGQKTLQLAKSALDRVNVRRMLLEIKRLITGVAQRLLFEPNNNETRARFINLVTPLLATVQAQAGIDSFQIVMDDTNNSSEDVENNRLNGRIVVVPTRAIEFIAIDFIITNSGVSFE